jgi:PAS domain S-box-containing protein
VRSADRLPTHVLDGLRTLAAQVALALEGAALTDGLSRQRSEARVGALVQNSSDMILVLDADLVIRYVTPSVGHAVGHRPDDLVGTSLLGLMEATVDQHLTPFFSRLAAKPGKSVRADWRMRRADGRLTDVEAVVTNLLDNPSVQGIVITAHDVTDRKALEIGLQRQVRELEELDRMRTEFVATVSHELRTPLTSIIGEVELLADGDLGELTAIQERAMDMIGRNSARLLTLIDDLLTLNHSEANALQLNLEATSVQALIDDARGQVAELAAGKPVALTVDCDPRVGDLLADPAQLDRALLNLLTNAVKFTPPGGTVTLEARRHDDDVVLRVRDTGVGIPEDEQDRLFTRFFRSSTATSLAIQGTGLGLVIVKQIVEQHGGTITVASAPGQGTTVTVILPAGDTAVLQSGAA